MTMPRRKNVDETKFLDEDNLYRAIKSNRLVKEYNLTLDEVKAVIRAYADIIYTCLKFDISVAFPKLGKFDKVIKKGYKGGWMMIADNAFQKGSTATKTYFPPKPDYGKIVFDVKEKVAEQFKEDTIVKGSEKRKDGNNGSESIGE
jgi:hypothetical protein